MDYQQIILSHLEKPENRGVTIEKLSKALGVSQEALKPALTTLQSEGLIFLNPRKLEYYLSSKFGLVKAKISRVRRNFSLAVTKTPDGMKEYKIDDRATKDAYFGDTVLLTPFDERSAEVFQVVSRSEASIVGEYVIGKQSYVIPDDDNYPFRIYIQKGHSKKAQSGHKVVVKIISYEPEITGDIIEIIGHKNDPRVDVMSLVYRFQVPSQFPEPVLKEIEYVPEEIQNIEDRVDLRERLIVTIDGADAKDLDDAVEAWINPNGTYHLGVHIADVSHYVTKYSAIDKEAVRRGTSVYLLDYVIPMLPHILSNGICSLNPDVDRYAMSCDMEINDKGNVVDYKIYRSVIRSKYRLTYDAVNAFLDGKGTFDEPLAKMMRLMDNLALIIRKEREDRGSLDFDAPEAKILINAEGKPTDIVLRERGEGERLIEDFMIIANETVASHIFWQHLPFVYRVHEKPKQQRLDILSTLVKSLGYRLKGEQSGIHPKELQNLLERTKGKPEHTVIATMTLRSMAKADYRGQNLGHFGLASKCYTHFTSPIRRYPDLLVHRLLKFYMTPQKIDFDAMNEEIAYLALQSSVCERRAVDLERAVEDMKKAEYMLDHIGEVYDGIVSGIIEQGFFVELPNTIEGMVRFETMNDDYYIYDEKRMIAIGSGSKRIIGLGKKVKVKVKSANKENGQIEFNAISF